MRGAPEQAGAETFCSSSRYPRVWEKALLRKNTKNWGNQDLKKVHSVLSFSRRQKAAEEKEYMLFGITWQGTYTEVIITPLKPLNL